MQNCRCAPTVEAGSGLVYAWLINYGPDYWGRGVLPEGAPAGVLTCGYCGRILQSVHYQAPLN
ncbi:MAG TPA: hypothetical protein VGF59_25925 [Bryobacteraceae bacterium]|jgi:hypothetical protein